VNIRGYTPPSYLNIQRSQLNLAIPLWVSEWVITQPLLGHQSAYWFHVSLPSKLSLIKFHALLWKKQWVLWCSRLCVYDCWYVRSFSHVYRATEAQHIWSWTKVTSLLHYKNMTIIIIIIFKILLHKKDGYHQWNVRQFLQSARRHILASPGYTPGTIAVNDTWMKKEDSMLVKHIAACTLLSANVSQ